MPIVKFKKCLKLKKVSTTDQAGDCQHGRSCEYTARHHQGLLCRVHWLKSRHRCPHRSSPPCFSSAKSEWNISSAVRSGGNVWKSEETSQTQGSDSLLSCRAERSCTPPQWGAGVFCILWSTWCVGTRWIAPTLWHMKLGCKCWTQLLITMENFPEKPYWSHNSIMVTLTGKSWESR